MADKDNLVPLGRVVVESGALMIGDPCYLEKWNEDNEPCSYSDAGVRDAFKDPKGGPIGPVCAHEDEVGGHRVGPIGLGFAIPTMFGDGIYQILGMTDEDGRIDAIVINLRSELSYAIENEVEARRA